MNYYGPYDPRDPYNLLPVTALLLMSSNFNPNGIDHEKRHLDFSYLNGTACPSNKFQDKINEEIARSISVNYNEISTSMWEDTCCAAKDEQIRLLQNQVNSLKIEQAMREMESERMYGNVINQLRSCSEPPRYTASKTGKCHFDVPTKFETDSYTNRLSINKGCDTSTLNDEVTVFYCDDRPILVYKHKDSKKEDISLACRMGLISAHEAAGWMSEYSEPVEFNDTFYKSLCETAQKEKSEAKTESISERENPIVRALRKFVEFLNEFVDLFIADWD